MVDIFGGTDAEGNESNVPAASDPADDTAYDPPDLYSNTVVTCITYRDRWGVFSCVDTMCI